MPPARLLLFCALLTASASSLAMTVYKTTDTFGVVSYSDRPSPGAKAFVFREPMVERLDGQVRLKTEPFAGGVRFVARNELFVPMEVELRVERLANAQGGNAPRIVRRLVPPRSTQVLSVVQARQGAASGTTPSFAMPWAIQGSARRAIAIPFPGRADRFA